MPATATGNPDAPHATGRHPGRAGRVMTLLSAYVGLCESGRIGEAAPLRTQLARLGYHISLAESHRPPVAETRP